MGDGNRHERRKADALARQRSRALLKLAGGSEDLLQFVASADAKVVRTVLLRLAYRGFKIGQLTAKQARLFGANVQKGKR